MIQLKRHTDKGKEIVPNHNTSCGGRNENKQIKKKNTNKQTAKLLQYCLIRFYRPCVMNNTVNNAASRGHDRTRTIFQ